MNDQAQPAGSRLDVAILDQAIILLGGGQEGLAFLQDFADSFAVELPALFAQLREHIVQQDSDGIGDILSRIKQRASILGLVCLQEAGQLLETDPSRKQSTAMVDALREHADRALSDLRIFFDARRTGDDAPGR